MLAIEGYIVNGHPENSTVDLGLRGYLGMTISNVPLYCSHYLYNIQRWDRVHLRNYQPRGYGFVNV
jgi:hypothetical protein